MQVLTSEDLSTNSSILWNVHINLKKDDELNTRFKTAKHLKIKGLENHIAAWFACKVYIKLNLDDYNKKKAELGIKNDLTPQRSKELK